MRLSLPFREYSPLPSVHKYSKSKRLLSHLWFRLILLFVFKKKAKKKQGSVANIEFKVSFTVSNWRMQWGTTGADVVNCALFEDSYLCVYKGLGHKCGCPRSLEGFRSPGATQCKFPEPNWGPLLRLCLLSNAKHLPSTTQRLTVRFGIVWAWGSLAERNWNLIIKHLKSQN